MDVKLARSRITPLPTTRIYSLLNTPSINDRSSNVPLLSFWLRFWSLGFLAMECLVFRLSVSRQNSPHGFYQKFFHHDELVIGHDDSNDVLDDLFAVSLGGGIVGLVLVDAG